MFVTLFLELLPWEAPVWVDQLLGMVHLSLYLAERASFPASRILKEYSGRHLSDRLVVIEKYNMFSRVCSQPPACTF